MYICKSGKTDQQDLALKIYDLARLFNIEFEVNWVQREQNKRADIFSEVIDTGDREITESYFELLTSMLAPFTIDRFANFNPRKSNSLIQDLLFLAQRQSMLSPKSGAWKTIFWFHL